MARVFIFFKAEPVTPEYLWPDHWLKYLTDVVFLCHLPVEVALGCVEGEV
jgi:hypothetical protein